MNIHLSAIVAMTKKRLEEDDREKEREGEKEFEKIDKDKDRVHEKDDDQEGKMKSISCGISKQNGSSITDGTDEPIVDNKTERVELRLS